LRAAAPPGILPDIPLERRAEKERHMKRILVATALILAAALTAAAAEPVVDTVYLKDGSVLKGTIKSLTEVTLRIVTTTGQDLTIAMDKVQRFERGTGGSGSAAADQAPDVGADPLSRLSLEVNLLGLLQFGPYVRLHVRVGPELFLSPHVRIGYAGALNYVFWEGGGIAAGVSLLKFLPAAGVNRFYLGGFTEAGIDYENDFVVVLGANAGHRWRLPNGSYWQAGIIAGASYDFWDEYLFVAGMLELSWGWELKRRAE
jgi:hypothetical protein